MKKIIFLALLVVLPFNSFAQDQTGEEDCKTEAVLDPAKNLIDELDAVTGKLYKDVATFKVNHDGDGKLSVYFEKGVPKILKFSYKNNSVVLTKTFEELENGSEIVYENKDRPGKAIIIKKGENFKSGDKYSFSLMLRSKVKPEEHKLYPIVFESNPTAPKVYYNNSPFKQIVISPGLRLLSWNGTFSGADFRK
jgi:hypothetical protein